MKVVLAIGGNIAVVPAIKYRKNPAWSCSTPGGDSFVLLYALFYAFIMGAAYHAGATFKIGSLFDSSGGLTLAESLCASAEYKRIAA